MIKPYGLTSQRLRAEIHRIAGYDARVCARTERRGPADQLEDAAVRIA